MGRRRRYPTPASTPPHFKGGVERNDPALGYTKHADAILLEPRVTVEPSQPGGGIVCRLPACQQLLIDDRVRPAARAKTVNEQCGNAGASQLVGIVDFTLETDPSV
jgi:hypothetical protein